MSQPRKTTPEFDKTEVSMPFLAKDLIIEKEARTKAESKAADLERQLSVALLDLKNEKQKLTRIEESYKVSQLEVCKIDLTCVLSDLVPHFHCFRLE